MLLENTLKYRVSTEAEAINMVENFRANANKEGYVLKKAGYEYKNKKSKGEIVAEAWVVTATQIFNTLWGEE